MAYEVPECVPVRWVEAPQALHVEGVVVSGPCILCQGVPVVELLSTVHPLLNPQAHLTTSMRLRHRGKKKGGGGVEGG